MAKAKTKSKRRTQSELANALYKTPSAVSDPARDAQLRSRARTFVSPLGGVASMVMGGTKKGTGR
jgi:hypothetical protein